MSVESGVTTMGPGTGFINMGAWQHPIGWPRLVVGSVGYKPTINNTIDLKSKVNATVGLKPKGLVDA